MEGNELFVYKTTASLRGVIWVGAIAVCPVFRNPSFSLTQVVRSAFFSFL